MSAELVPYRPPQLWKAVLAFPIMLLPIGSDTIAEELERKEVFSEARVHGDALRLRAPLHLDRSLSIQSNEVLSAGILIEGAVTGIVLDCHGGAIRRYDRGTRRTPAIEIRSRRREGPDGAVVWERPSGVSIRNCRIEGRVQISGMPGNGEDLRQSSRRQGHTVRTQAAAPFGISLESVSITTDDDIPIYVGSGVTRVNITKSRIDGFTRSVAIYLDAESGDNFISGNEITTKTGREVIAIDGSANNRIIENKIYIDEFPGISLYRNCGEKGVIRHQTPSFNIIDRNHFVNNSKHRPRHVVENSRGGRSPYCHEDDGYPFGSSIDNTDGGVGNIIR
ncbi:right-handed parallel beta-helix repeat-containing protein [Bosea sp. NPDC055353]